MIRASQLPVLKQILHRQEQEVIYLTLSREVRLARLVDGSLRDEPLKRGILDACFLGDNEGCSVLVTYTIREQFWIYYQWNSNFNQASYYRLLLPALKPKQMRLTGSCQDPILIIDGKSFVVKQYQEVSERDRVLVA